MASKNNNIKKLNDHLLPVYVIIVLLSLFVAIVAVISTWEIAEQSGAFHRGLLEVNVGNYTMIPGVETNVVLGVNPILSKELNEKIPILGTFFLIISNSGEKTLENVDVTFRYGLIFDRDKLEEMTAGKDFGSLAAIDMKRHFSRSHNQFYVSYLIPALKKDAQIGIYEPILLRETRKPMKVHVDDIIIHGRFDVSYKMLITVSVNNIGTIDYPISLKMFPAESLDELTKVVVSRIIPQRAREIRRSMSFLGYLGLWAFGNTKESIALLFTKTEPMKLNEKAVGYFSNEKYEQSTLTWEPVIPKYFFQRD